MKTYLTTALVAGTAFSAFAGSTVVGQYLLGDHPDGNQSPPPYGLRIDNILDAGAITLSIGHHNDTVLTVYDDGGNLSINISGTLYGGLLDGVGGYVSAESYAVDFTYGVNVNALANGWEVNGFDAGNAGTLTNLGTNVVTDLYGKPNMSGLNFAFLADGHRLGDNTTWVGRGWLTGEVDGSDPLAGDRDWLFTATEIPAPGSFALLGLGGLVAARRRR